MGKWAAGAFLMLCLACQAGRAGTPARCEKPWLFFDLGNTIVDTRAQGEDPKNEKIRYMPAVRSYLEVLRSKHYRMGLIINIPESWGVDRPRKITFLKKYISDHWDDSEPMDWSYFDLGILVPPSDLQRKPNPYLFEEALQMARKEGCPAIYQGETPREVTVANEVGLRGYEVGRKGRFFLPEREIATFLSH